MRVYINLDTREFVVSPVLTQRVSTIYFTRRDVVPVEVQFVRGGTVVELAAGATGQIGIKKTFGGGFLATDSAWTKTGTGAATVYTFDLSLNTTETNAEFPLDTEISISAKVEVSWTISSTVTSTMPCEAMIYNDVIRSGDANPTTVGSTYFTLTSPDNTVWQVSVDNNGIITTTPQ